MIHSTYDAGDGELDGCEARSVGDKTFHLQCFVCALCLKQLNTNNARATEANIFCEHCYKRKYGPKGIGFGGTSGALSMDPGEQSEHNVSNASNKEAEEEEN
ncbi:Cysteine and glycine-rich protein 3-like protein [Leptotrombidium deliense]|uniref:Cysteine and glycine-rich protein 3-like protein n=1 Tax=Leptotrombidium deliense TaxID=299467 RepID=A0A443RXJ0_9ACAR|nr:Cysteine and glycine-rich protein 3-like protein [Leptotrombidium deliense]